MHLNDLIPSAVLEDAINGKLVRHQEHPFLPYLILNYTEKAQVNSIWNKATLNCRGLIVHAETGEIIARPFRKFFNYGEKKKLQRWRPDEMVVVTDKMDGSLGIVYTDDAGIPLIATRGSFTSGQARHANHVLRTKYPEWRPPKGKTVLVEIIYPENRIVVDYGDTDDLVLLGMVDIETGISYGPRALLEWPGPRAETFPYLSLREALSAPPRPGKEGLVVHFVDSDDRVKIKQNDYVALHRIVTGLNEQVVWEHLKYHDDVSELIEGLPDEFYDWAVGVMQDLTEAAFAMKDDVDARFRELARAGLASGPRKDFALAIKDDPAWMKACLFKVLDGQEIEDLIWKQLKPSGDKTPNSA